jgi:hypothetical protein
MSRCGPPRNWKIGNARVAAKKHASTRRQFCSDFEHRVERFGTARAALMPEDRTPTTSAAVVYSLLLPPDFGTKREEQEPGEEPHVRRGLRQIAAAFVCTIGLICWGHSRSPTASTELSETAKCEKELVVRGGGSAAMYKVPEREFERRFPFRQQGLDRKRLQQRSRLPTNTPRSSVTRPRSAICAGASSLDRPVREADGVRWHASKARPSTD